MMQKKKNIRFIHWGGWLTLKRGSLWINGHLIFAW